MTKIYIIKASGGSYDDAWESNLFAVGDAEKAELAVWDLQEQHKFCASIWPAVSAAREEYYARIRSFDGEKCPPEPKGPAKPTKQSMRELSIARDQWRRACQPIMERNRAKLDTIMLEACEAAKAKAIELGAKEVHLKTFGFFSHDGRLQTPSFNADTNYEFEELELQ